MNLRTVVALVLIAAGTVGLVLRNVDVTQRTHALDVGGLQLSVREKHRVDIPVWASVGVLVLGVVVLVARPK